MSEDTPWNGKAAAFRDICFRFGFVPMSPSVTFGCWGRGDDAIVSIFSAELLLMSTKRSSRCEGARAGSFPLPVVICRVYCVACAHCRVSVDYVAAGVGGSVRKSPMPLPRASRRSSRRRRSNLCSRARRPPRPFQGTEVDTSLPCANASCRALSLSLSRSRRLLLCLPLPSS